MAIAVARTAPAMIMVGNCRFMPSKIRTPSPPPLMYAPMVAIPMIVTVAMRIPATMIGSASGSSTRKRIWVRQAHAAGRVYRLRWYGVDARDGVADKDQERVGHEGDDHGRRPDNYPWYGDEDGEEREAWYGVEDPRDEGDRRVDLAVAGGDDPDG